VSRYFYGGQGARYHYESQPLLACPIESDVSVARDDGPDHQPITLAALDALDRLGLDGTAILRRAHRGSARFEKTIDGMLCETCHAPAISLGYRAWCQLPLDHPEAEESPELGRAAQRLGFAYTSGPSRLFEKKRDAIEWARKEANLSASRARNKRGRRTRA
jgi:hypothetical protein